jgi:hypothetical protein
MKKEKKIKAKFELLSTSKLILGVNIYEANKTYSIDKKTANLIKTTSFYKKGLVEIK